MSSLTSIPSPTDTEPLGRRKSVLVGSLLGLAKVIASVFAVLGKQAGLWGLVPIVVYAALALLSVDVLLATAAALLVATGPS